MGELLSFNVVAFDEDSNMFDNFTTVHVSTTSSADGDDTKVVEMNDVFISTAASSIQDKHHGRNVATS